MFMGVFKIVLRNSKIKIGSFCCELCSSVSSPPFVKQTFPFSCLLHCFIKIIDKNTVSECVCPPDSKIKYSVFYVFMYYTMCCFTSIFYAVVRQISVIHRQ